MNLIDRYVAEVGKRLPLLKGREDVEKELKSTLEDMLEDKARQAGRPRDEAMEIELLKEYGSPQKVAASYNPHPYLIGPRMFPFFLMILKMVAFGVTVGLSVVLIIQIITQIPMTSTDLVQVIGSGIGKIISTLIAGFGYVVLAFAIMERVVPTLEFEADEEKEWDPASLMKEPEPDEVKLWEPILTIVFTFVVISLFNFNRQLLALQYGYNNGLYIGWWVTGPGQRGVIPLFTEAFFRWLPLMNIGWVADIILNGLLLRAGKWTIGTRLFSIAIKAFQTVILALLITGPSIMGITAESLQASGVFNVATAEVIGNMAQTAALIALGLGIFGNIVEIIKTGYKMITGRPSPATA